MPRAATCVIGRSSRPSSSTFDAATSPRSAQSTVRMSGRGPARAGPLSPSRAPPPASPASARTARAILPTPTPPATCRVPPTPSASRPAVRRTRPASATSLITRRKHHGFCTAGPCLGRLTVSGYGPDGIDNGIDDGFYARTNLHAKPLPTFQAGARLSLETFDAPRSDLAFSSYELECPPGQCTCADSTGFSHRTMGCAHTSSRLRSTPRAPRHR